VCCRTRARAVRASTRVWCVRACALQNTGVARRTHREARELHVRVGAVRVLRLAHVVGPLARALQHHRGAAHRGDHAVDDRLRVDAIRAPPGQNHTRTRVRNPQGGRAKCWRSDSRVTGDGRHRRNKVREHRGALGELRLLRSEVLVKVGRAENRDGCGRETSLDAVQLLRNGRQVIPGVASGLRAAETEGNAGAGSSNSQRSASELRDERSALDQFTP
jgi:hypothetical protein